MTRIKRRLRMWEIAGTEFVQWKVVRYSRSQTWAQVRARHRYLDPGAMWLAVRTPDGPMLVRAAPGSMETAQKVIDSHGGWVRRWFQVPRR